MSIQAIAYSTHTYTHAHTHTHTHTHTLICWYKVTKVQANTRIETLVYIYTTHTQVYNSTHNT